MKRLLEKILESYKFRELNGNLIQEIYFKIEEAGLIPDRSILVPGSYLDNFLHNRLLYSTICKTLNWDPAFYYIEILNVSRISERLFKIKVFVKLGGYPGMKMDIAVPISKIARLLNKVVKKSETPRPTLKHLIGKEVLVKARYFRGEIFVEEVIK